LLFLLSFSAGATIITSPVTIGTAGLYPDITIDSTGQIVFTAGIGGGGNLTFTANDLIIAYSVGNFEFLAGKVDFKLMMAIDNLGNFTGNMEEEAVANFTLTNAPGGPYSYNIGEIVLSGPVALMQWDNVGGTARYGFQIDPVSGEFVNDFWPPFAINLFGISETNAWPGPAWWNGGNFVLDKCKADKAATPEPGTLLLLGFGLVGMAGYAWLRKKKQS
jgi:hypothetical protein